MSETISPLFRVLSLQVCNHLENPNPKEFKIHVKKSILSQVRKTMENYVKGVPFLHFTYDNIIDGEIHFSSNLKEFLDSRSILQLKIQETSKTMGILMPTNGGFILNINIDYTSPLSRAVTTLAHEMGHTFFYKFSNNKPKLIFDKKLLEDKHCFRQYEGLAFEIGRELILPEKYFKRYITANNLEKPSLQNFIKMIKDLKVISKDVLAKRIFEDLRFWDAYLFWGYLKDQDIQVKDSNKYRIKKGKFRYFNLKEGLKENGKIYLKSVLINAIVNMEEITGREIYCKSKNFNRRCRLDISLLNRTDTNNKKWFIAMLYY